MAELLKERPLPEQEPSIASVAVIDSDRIIVECNSAAEASLLGESARGRKFDAKLSEAVKFGRISAAAVSQIRSAVEKGSGAFHMEDGKVFVLHSRRVGEATRIEWTDISSAVGAASDRTPISGLLTRHGFLSALEEIRSRAPTGVVVHLDLDDFKGVNDLFGHEIGDRLIRRVTERISGQLDGAKAGLAHGTGGEFYFVIENDHAETLIAGLLDILGRPYLIDGNMIYSTASMGSTPYTEGNGNETIVRSASLALRNAKADGGNQHVAFSADMQRALQRRHALEIELRKALTLREFSLAYQPQFRIEGRRLVGFEALLRWNHPTNGAVSPGEFIPLAEELGLIVPIGEWVLRTACQQAASWPADISISVNVSPLQFRSPAIVATVRSALEASGLHPARLDLEVTEGAILMNSVPVMDTFSQLKALGVRFSMDDFGTGYSSLSYLQKFPFDKIKIDQSFVRTLSANTDSRAIIRAICALGKALGMTTIAEGVETEEQLTQIARKGCQLVQGHLTGRPLAADAAKALVAETASEGRRG